MSEDGLIMAEEQKALSSDAKLQYPKLQLDDYEPRICSPRVKSGNKQFFFLPIQFDDQFVYFVI